MVGRRCWLVMAVLAAFSGCDDGQSTAPDSAVRIVPVAGGAAGGAGRGGASGGAGAAGVTPSGQGGGGVGSTAGNGGAGGGAGAPVTRIASGPPGPRFIGRFTSDGAFAWSGSAIELRFTGDEVSVTLDDWGHNFFEIVIDGVHDVLEVDAGVNTYLLASGLEPGEHEVLVYRRTEAFFGPSRFLGFSLPESAWLPSYAPAERRIEIIADSTAVGYGVEGPDQYCPFEAETENSYVAYGELVARALGAEVRTLGWSGIGVYRDGDGNPENNMRVRYPRALPTEEDSTWDFARWIPHVVVVNLGSNDFVADDPGPEFEEAYLALLAEVRGHYPDARIYCAVGSSIEGSEYPRLKARLEKLVGDRKASGDDVQLLDFGTTDYDDTYACDWHPSAATHQAMADTLLARLAAEFGWQRLR